jgi:hypothetical protein
MIDVRQYAISTMNCILRDEGVKEETWHTAYPQ